MDARSSTYQIDARTAEEGVSLATCKSALPISFDTSPGQSEDRFGPAELLAASLAACLLKNLARLAPKMRFRYDGATVHVTAFREDAPPRISRLEYTLRIRSDESREQVDRLADHLRRYSTVFNTLSKACPIDGKVVAVPTENGAAEAAPVAQGGAR